MAASIRERRGCYHSRSLFTVAVLLSSCFFNCWAVDDELYNPQIMGINYGIIADNIPDPAQSVALMQSMKVGKVRIYDADPAILSALANAGLQTAISVTTDLIGGIATDESTADQWIADNVVAYPNSQITFIIVGNELFSYPSLNFTWYQVLPAMNNLHTSLLNRGMSDTVKITTCLAIDILAASFPPSAGVFRSDIETPLMQPILEFISSSQSTFFLNVYPYFAWADNSAQVSLDYALFATGTSEVTVLDGQLTYTSLLDAQVDAVIAAMDKVGYGDANLAIGETGWPTAGDPTQIGANIAYAASYNRRLVRRTMSNPPNGTPRRSGEFIPTYLFALYDEDLKPGPGTERNWGLRYANSSAIYPIDLTGQLTDADYPPLTAPAQAPATSNPEGGGGAAGPAQSTPFGTSGTWCIANPSAQPDQWQAAIDWACGAGGADCAPIQVGGSCYIPNTLDGHGSYAFNSYFQQYKTKGGTCDFNGAAILTTVNPSVPNSTCVYPYTP